MPKLKTRRAAAKRFRITGTGKLQRRHAFRNHLLGHKSSKRKRFLATSQQWIPRIMIGCKECCPTAVDPHT